MKALGAIMAWAYIVPVTGSIRGEHRMILVDGAHAVCTGELRGQEGPR